MDELYESLDIAIDKAASINGKRAGIFCPKAHRICVCNCIEYDRARAVPTENGKYAITGGRCRHYGK